MIKPVDWLIFCSMAMFVIYLYHDHWINTEKYTAHFLSVTVKNQPPLYYALHKNQLFSVKGEIGFSEIEIKNGQVRFRHSPCKNQLCTLHGWLMTSGSVLACLPNRISLSLYNNHPDYDSINF